MAEFALAVLDHEVRKRIEESARLDASAGGYKPPMEITPDLPYQQELMREAFNFVYATAYKKRAQRLARIAEKSKP